MNTINSARRELLKFSGMGLAAAAAAAVPSAYAAPRSSSTAFLSRAIFDIRSFGAVGDGKIVDSPAINKAIEAAAAAGGGTVFFPAGTWLSFSIRLKSHVGLYLSQGCILLAADSPSPAIPTGYNGGTYDAAEPNTAWDAYQDYGHNHWKNSLLWGIDLQDVSITGPGLIYGKGSELRRRSGPSSGSTEDDWLWTERQPGAPTPPPVRPSSWRLPDVPGRAARRGEQGDRDEELPQRDLPRLLDPQGGHWVPAHRRRQSDHRQHHDRHRSRRHRYRLLQKRSRLQLLRQFALGRRHLPEVELCARVCSRHREHDDHQLLRRRLRQLGTMLDGTYKKIPADTPRVARNGRIKCGTESNGGFKNITISNCVFEACEGLALESEDGALCEDIAISNITMRDVVECIRCSSASEPACADQEESTKVGTLQRIVVDNLVSYNTVPRISSILSGIPDNPIQDIKLSNIFIQHLGGGSAEDAKIVMPEKEAAYPDPGMFGHTTPSQGFFLRHINRLGDEPRRGCACAAGPASELLPGRRRSRGLHRCDRPDQPCGLCAPQGHRSSYCD